MYQIHLFNASGARRMFIEGTRGQLGPMLKKCYLDNCKGKHAQWNGVSLYRGDIFVSGIGWGN